MELGVTEVVQRHVARHVVAPKPVSQRKLDFEHARPRWFRECLAEATGVFFYTFPGITSVAMLLLNAGNPALPVTVFGSFFQTGWCFGMGIAFAILTCASTSGGHFNPCITIALAFWQGFPWKKVPQYILSQIFGAFIAGLVVAGMYWTEIKAVDAKLIAAGHPLVANGNPASIFCTLPGPNQTNLGYVFMVEFFAGAFVSIVIWACIDPANPFVSPSGAPFAIGLAYSAIIWGLADLTLSLNMAKDLGTRMVGAIFYGREAFTYMNYSPIAILVSIPATLFGTAYYEFLMRDSLANISAGHADHEEGEEGLVRHLSRTGGFKDGELERIRTNKSRAEKSD